MLTWAIAWLMKHDKTDNVRWIIMAMGCDTAMVINIALVFAKN